MKNLIAGGLLLLSLAVAGGARAQCATYPDTLTNGTTADATQVMANFNCAALTGAAHFTGNVGIGTTTPQALLDLGGTITTIKLAAYDGGGTNIYGIGVNAGELTFGANIGTTGVPQMVLTAAGAVGIGTTSPETVLDLGQAITTLKLAVFDGGGTNFYGVGVNSGELTFGAAIAPTGTPQMVLTDTGNLGVGTTTPTYPLYVNGTAYATGAAGALSDIRHKKNVERLAPGALGIIGQLRPVTFEWREPKDNGMKGRQIGFIAQDVQKVLPQVVLTENNAEKTLGLKYDQIIPVLTAAIQEQQAEIAALKTRLAALQARVDQASPSH